MNRIIALCTDADSFLENRIFNPACAAKFPGAEAMSELAKIVRRQNIEIVTADVALSHINTGHWRPEEIMLIAEADSRYGLELINLGCSPKIILCFESPIFAWQFYDKLNEIAPKFEHRILFKGAFDITGKITGQNHIVYFPAFSRNKIPQPKKWAERKNMVLVAANKYWKKSSHFPLSLDPGKYLKWWRRYKIENNSPTLKSAIHNELQSKRLELIEFFAGKGKLDIFGRNWQNLSKLPACWQNRLKNILTNLSPQPCDDKIETISNYKFAVAFENVSYPGYITEKIIDCLVAGVIPVYLGAADICDFIPKEIFIDMRQFENFKRLDEYMQSFIEKTAMQMIKAGRDFLNSPQGDKYSFENSAEQLFGLLTNNWGKK